jgi:hypothetical protein
MKDLFVAVLDFLRKEKRGWVIVLLAIAFFSFLFRAQIGKVINDYDPVKKQAYLSEQVNDELAKILDYSGADRVYIFQFHNGISFYNGQHAQRFTCTYEIVSKGTSKEAGNLVNLQVSVFSWFITQTLEGNMCYTDTKDIPDYTTRYTLHAQGIKSIKVLPIIKNGKVIGLIGVDYVKSHNETLGTKITTEWFSQEAETIADILD